MPTDRADWWLACVFRKEWYDRPIPEAFYCWPFGRPIAWREGDGVEGNFNWPIPFYSHVTFIHLRYIDCSLHSTYSSYHTIPDSGTFYGLIHSFFQYYSLILQPCDTTLHDWPMPFIVLFIPYLLKNGYSADTFDAVTTLTISIVLEFSHSTTHSAILPF